MDSIKIKVSTIFEWIIILCCILILGYTLLPEKDYIGYYAARIIVAMLSIVSAVVTVAITPRNSAFRKIIQFLNRYIVPYSLVISMMCLYSLIAYQYEMGDLYKIVLPYTFVYLAYPITYVFYRQDSMNKLMMKVSFLVVGILVLKMISWYFYNFQGIVVFERLLFEFDKWFRNGLQRVNAGYLVGIVAVFLFAKGNSGVKRIYYYGFVAFIIFFLIYVSAYRFQVIVTCFACAVVYYFYQGKNKKVFSRRVLLFFLLIALFMSEPVQDLIASFAVSQSGIGYSTLVRVMNIQHYCKLMIDRVAVFGLGFIAKDNSVSYALMSYNGGEIFWLEDVGILGGFFRFGLFSLFLYGYPFWQAIALCKALRKNNRLDLRPIAFGTTAYMIISCLALNMFDGQRAFDVPFYMAILAYLKYSVYKPISSQSNSRVFSREETL